ncbi:hypothetical protein [Staphylococcus carnosus]|uniref:hypothetical protein n=1 Tax=Staphylococcus carnosus TaxID=1281 RepID=UPI0011975C20|nr:hypothetical protein [Staphylococcus carnosus]GEP77163.1 hypothetical protein SCA04_14770 [Staphylococcus carnosus]GEP79381.1 hypothetical protein SCA05_11740 [Staphylococcus carnosus]
MNTAADMHNKRNKNIRALFHSKIDRCLNKSSKLPTKEMLTKSYGKVSVIKCIKIIPKPVIKLRKNDIIFNPCCLLKNK